MTHTFIDRVCVLVLATAVLVAWGAGRANAQIAPDAVNAPAAQDAAKAPKVKTASASGIVLALVDKSSFSLVDKTGAVTTVRFNAATTYGGKKSTAAATTMQAVLVPGMKVKAALAPDGTATQITSSGLSTQLTIDQLKPFMHCSDNEWTVLKPMIEKVLNLQSIADGNGPMDTTKKSDAGDGAAVQTATAASPVADPLAAPQGLLLSAVYDAESIPAQLVERLSSYRDARIKAREDLAQARKDLAGVVTQRQEALLVSQDILE
jgi:hypothetical protein